MYKKILAGCDAEGLTELLKRRQPPIGRILEALDAWNADLIVMGVRRVTNLGGLVVGSIAHIVFRQTKRPVLLAERP